jgi:hypothetical protein
MRWEYKVSAAGIRASMSDDRLQAELDKIGADGWELVALNGEQFIFKRPIA